MNETAAKTKEIGSPANNRETEIADTERAVLDKEDEKNVNGNAIEEITMVFRRYQDLTCPLILVLICFLACLTG